MKVYLTEVEFGRLEPMADNFQRYDFEKLIEVDDDTVKRWRQALDDYNKVQAEMEEAMDRAYRESEPA